MDIRSIVERSDSEVLAEWEAGDDCELNGMIREYRAALRDLVSKFDEKPCYQRIEENERNRTTRRFDPSEWQVPPHCIPILADVRTYNWRLLYEMSQFDVIMMDPPWQLATSNPTRGVALSYGQLTNKDIIDIPIHNLQENGLLFIWVINSSFDFAMTLFDTWGYEIVDELVWAKLTVNRRLAKSHGYYLQHAKEMCLVGVKGKGPEKTTQAKMSDVILSERRGQSQKPDEIYDLIEALVPNGKYLEIFARKNNLRNFWVSLGNEVIGTVPCSTTETKL